jgi:hypothetical protein
MYLDTIGNSNPAMTRVSNLSLLNGLSGSPVVTFTDHRWKIIGMGMALFEIRRLKHSKHQGNEVLMVRPAWLTMVLGWIRAYGET